VVKGKKSLVTSSVKVNSGEIEFGLTALRITSRAFFSSHIHVHVFKTCERYRVYRQSHVGACS